MNKITLIGNLTQDIEAKTTTSGKTINEITIALNESEKTTYLQIKKWGNCPALSKGEKVLIIGHISRNVWTDKENKKHYDNDIIADFVTSEVKYKEHCELEKVEPELPL